MNGMPQWAKDMMPLTYKQAAEVLGVSERTLWRLVEVHPHFERRGRGNAYYPEHIEKLRYANEGKPSGDGRLVQPVSHINQGNAKHNAISPEVQALLAKAAAAGAASQSPSPARCCRRR